VSRPGLRLQLERRERPEFPKLSGLPWLVVKPLTAPAATCTWKGYALERHPEAGVLPWIVLRPVGEMIARAADLDTAKGIVEYDV
jgi:hypothetical protein